MLTPSERVQSNAHKNLRRLRGYTKIADYKNPIPENLNIEEILGVYTNRDNTRFFVTLEGIYIESTSDFITYMSIDRVDVVRDGKTKHEADTLRLTLRDGTQTELQVLQAPTNDIHNRTQETWLVFSFLKGVLKNRK